MSPKPNLVETNLVPNQRSNDAKRLVFLTAGAAGMFCGSCMHDNAVAKALINQGVDCLLQPVYTPIRTDQDSVASEKVFFGGIQIYALQRFPWFRSLPESLRRLLDFPGLIRLATRKSRATDASMLGELAISMLRGDDGFQAQESRRLTAWLASEIKPDALVLSNLLIGGSLPLIRQSLPDTQIAVLLQGDDIFLDHLPDDLRNQAIDLCRKLVPSVDLFISNSEFYSDKMGQLLEIPPEKRVVIPLSIDVSPFGKQVECSAIESLDDASFRLGYMARIAPEKGFDRLVDAFISLASQPNHEGSPSHDDLHLHVAGWLGEHNQDYFDQQLSKLKKSNLMHRFHHHGSPDIDQKVAYLKTLDLVCVPTEYEDPKGLFVLEALAAGVPVVQPDHGAFGELVKKTEGGLLYKAGDPDDLVKTIEKLKCDKDLRNRLALSGKQSVMKSHAVEQTATRLSELLLQDSLLPVYSRSRNGQ